MSFFEDSTIAWYIDWLAENHPEIDEAMRLELATGFVALQRPAQKVNDSDEDVLLDGQTVGNLRASDRSEQRKQQRLSKAQLEKIIGVKL